MPDCKTMSRMMNRQRNWGFTHTELMVSAAVLLATVSLVTSLSFRIQRVWRDVDYQRVAVNELQNHLDRLVRMDEVEADAYLSQLAVTEKTQRVFKTATIVSNSQKDSLGTRITLKIQWESRIPTKPVEMSAWVRGVESDSDSPNPDRQESVVDEKSVINPDSFVESNAPSGDMKP